jgi:C4-dicarboxylate transporter DctM subunit
MLLFIAITVALIFLALSGMPIFAVIAATALVGFYLSDIEVTVVAIELYRIVDTPMLVALPLFTLAGYLLAESNASQRLVRTAQAAIGWLPGGLGVIALVTCAFFTAFTGASGVTIVAIGALLYPALVKVGFSDKFSLGLVTSSGSLGLLLAPSLPLILYGIVAQQSGLDEPFSIQDLFIAGLLPAALMLVLLSLWAVWQQRDQWHQRQRFTVAELGAALWEARWELPLPFVVFGGIYAGWLAVSETAAVIALYVLIVEVLLYKDIKVSALPDVFRKGMIMAGSIILILGVALGLTNIIVDAEIPARLFEFVQQHVDSKYTFLILLNIFLLLLGAVLDIFSALVIMVPLILPLAVGYGIHPVHLGIIFLANMQIGYMTPPVGMNLFIASYRFKKPITELYSASLPFMVILLVALMLITYWPWLSLGLL